MYDPNIDFPRVYPVARRLFDAVVNNDPSQMTSAVMVDFGLDTPLHIDAIVSAIRNGATLVELSEALGNGPAITALVEKYSGYQGVIYKTSYDFLEGR